MDHIAILNPDWNLLEKIINGEKTIESRWYKTRRAPWGRIKTGETVYFKDSGQPITAKATVGNVLLLSNLNPTMSRDILEKYQTELVIREVSTSKIHALVKNAKYCILIFLKNPVKIKPFNISKKGFGSQSAWLSVDNIAKIRRQI